MQRISSWAGLAALLVLAPHHAGAATFTAKVESGNTVVVTGKSRHAEKCSAGVHFTYVDPKTPGKREGGSQTCAPKTIPPGKPYELCRMDYPVTDIKLSGPVEWSCDKPTP